MPYKPGWLFCLWGTARQQLQCTSGGKKARGPRRQKRFVCDGASKQQGRILSFDQATYLLSKRDQTSNFQRIKKNVSPCPFWMPEALHVWSTDLGLLGPFFPVAPGQGAMQQLALRWFSWQESGRWSRSESSKYGGFPGKRGLCSENYLGVTTVQGRVFTIQRRYFLMSKNARSNCGETGAGHQARTCKGNVISHMAESGALVVSACGASIAQSRKERMGRYGHMTLQPA